MFDIVDTAFSYEREMIVCSFLKDFSEGKGSTLLLICNAHTAFLLCGAEYVELVPFFLLVQTIQYLNSALSNRY